MSDQEMEVDNEGIRPQRLRSAVTTDSQGKKQKGRGFRDSAPNDRFADVDFESLEATTGSGPQKSVEGWVVFVTNVHEEAQEEDIHEAFREFGDIKNIYLNLDRQTGFVKGYALVEYGNKKEAQDAIDEMNNKELLTQKIQCSWAFSRGPIRKGGHRR